MFHHNLSFSFGLLYWLKNKGNETLDNAYKYEHPH